MILKYLYDVNLFVCPFCHDSWYTYQNNKYRVCCHCGSGTNFYSSKKEAEKEWYKIVTKKFNKKDELK